MALCPGLLKDVVKYRDQENAQQGRGQHAGKYRSADGPATAGSGSGGNDHGCNPQDKGESGHQDRPETNVCPFNGSFVDGQSLFSPVFGKFDDEDGIFGRQSHQQN